MAKTLTIKGIEAIKPGDTRREVPDGLIRGLFFVVQPSGAKSWAVRYRFNGLPRKLTLGAFPAIDLKASRELAQRALVAVAAGEDPASAKQAAKAAARAPADRDGVEKVVSTFVERYAKANTREGTWKETERLLNKEVIGAWKGRHFSAIRRADVHELLDGIVDRGAPIVANKTLAALRRMCGWAVERGIITTSPCEGVKAPSAERSRDRVLADDELRRVWAGCDAIGWPFGPLLQVLILTGQRRDEVAEMQWSEVDLDGKTWTLPRSRVKNDQAHSVPLSDQALRVLATLPRIGTEHGGPIFTTTGESSVSGFSRAKKCIDKEIAAEFKLAPWVIHDLRRTLASGMARLGINLPVIERVLNHTSGSFAGVVGVYQRHSFADEKRHALAAWGAHVDTLMSGAPEGNVVELARRDERRRPNPAG
jgi:integrase